MEKYLKSNDSDKITSLLRINNSSNDLVNFINGTSLVLVNEKVDNAFDKDIASLKKEIKKLADEVLSKLDFIDIIQDKPVDVKKIKISTIDGETNKTIKISKDEISNLKKEADKIYKLLPNDEKIDQNSKLYLISLLTETILKE